MAAALFACAHAAHGSGDGPANGEIEHLLDFVAASSCTFVRNGAEYQAARAREHLAAKYRFAAGRIGSAEEFIRYLGTQSGSGEPYRVRCGGTDAPSRVWLTDELRRHRATRARASR